MTPSFARRAGVAGGLALVLGAFSAMADEPRNLEQAESLFEQGVTLLDAGRYAEACPKLEAARALVRGVGVTLYLAECYARTARPVKAWQRFTEAEDMAIAAKDRRAAVARARAERLWPSLSKLTIEVAANAGVSGLAVTDDDVEVGHSMWNVARPVDPGTHRIRATAPGRARWETSIEVPGAGQAVRVEAPPLDLLPQEPSSPPSFPSAAPPNVEPSRRLDAIPVSPPPAKTETPLRPDTQRVAAITLLGLGVVGAATGAAFGVDAKSKLDDSNASGRCQPGDRCTAAGLTERSEALTSASASTVLFIAGAACIAGGAVMYWLDPKTRARIAIAPNPERVGGGLVVRGSW